MFRKHGVSARLRVKGHAFKKHELRAARKCPLSARVRLTLATLSEYALGMAHTVIR